MDTSLCPETYAFRTNLGKKPTLLYDSPVVLRNAKQKCRILNVSLCHEPSTSREYPLRPLFFAHVCCWKLIRRQNRLS